MMYSVVSHVKKELYEKTQCRIARSNFRKSETICFTEKDLKDAEWKEENEFTLDRSSYDIIEISTVNGEKYFFCYIDKRDIIINSLVDFSKKLAVQSTDRHRHIDCSLNCKSSYKTSAFLAVISRKEYSVSYNSDFRTFPGYHFPFVNTSYISIISPPPKMGSLSKQI